MDDFPLLFLAHVLVFYVADFLIQMLTGEKIVSFLFLHLLMATIVLNSHPTRRANKKELLWIAVTVAHGIAHIAHPAFINGTEVNPDYTPLYDFTIHAFQCLLVWYYHKELFPVGVFGAIVMLVGSGMAHLNKDFLATNYWLFVSGWGVFGAVYHMMLLNHTRNKNVFYANLLIWTLPYAGYLFPGYIPVWDNFVNRIGLFRIWFGAYYTTQHIYNQNVEIYKIPYEKI